MLVFFFFGNVCGELGADEVLVKCDFFLVALTHSGPH